MLYEVITLKALVLYLGSTAIAISIGLLLGHLFTPGAGIEMTASVATPDPKTAPSLVDTLVALVPKNPVQALASGEILQIIVFAVGLGLSLNLIGDHGKPAVALFKSRITSYNVCYTKLLRWPAGRVPPGWYCRWR